MQAKLREAIGLPSADANDPSLFTLTELEVGLKTSTAEKAQGPDKIHSKFLHHLQFLVKMPNVSLGSLTAAWSPVLFLIFGEKVKPIPLLKLGCPSDNIQSYHSIILL